MENNLFSDREVIELRIRNGESVYELHKDYPQWKQSFIFRLLHDCPFIYKLAKERREKEVLDKYATGNYTQCAIAREHECPCMTITRIVRRK